MIFSTLNFLDLNDNILACFLGRLETIFFLLILGGSWGWILFFDLPFWILSNFLGAMGDFSRWNFRRFFIVNFFFLDVTDDGTKMWKMMWRMRLQMKVKHGLEENVVNGGFDTLLSDELSSPPLAYGLYSTPTPRYFPWVIPLGVVTPLEMGGGSWKWGWTRFSPTGGVFGVPIVGIMDGTCECIAGSGVGIQCTVVHDSCIWTLILLECRKGKILWKITRVLYQLSYDMCEGHIYSCN